MSLTGYAGMSVFQKYCIAVFLIVSVLLPAQNETAKWYFGNTAGLDFLTNPPTPLLNSAMNVYEGNATMSDAAGNLLFYTDGITVYNSQHQVMANGSGLLGNNTPCQSSLIIKKPGSSTLYYIFTISGIGSTSGLNYSIVDMALAAGQGSITVKNSNLYSGSCGEKLTGTKHCNGVDYWVLCRDWNASTSATNFRAYLLTNTGVSASATVSPGWSWSWNNNINYYDLGYMKISPNGKKIGLALYNYNNLQNNLTNNHSFEIYDFDNNTGAVTNSVALGAWTNTLNWANYAYGCEFSPDGTKFYGTRLYSNSISNGGIFQYDLCAGSPSAIAASEYAVFTNTANVANYYPYAMQMAKNGKIYICQINSTWMPFLSVINNPNASGAACNYSMSSQSLSGRIAYYGLPNFINSYFIQPPPAPPFTYTVSNAYGCQSALFNSPAAPNTTISGCSAIGYSLNSLAWNFGDPASGAANTSFATNPVHAFSTLGTYTVQLILYYSCGGGTDTLRQVVNINQPCITVNSTSITCANLGSATVQATGGVGPYSYTWMPTSQTSSVASGLSPGTYTLTVHDFGNNFTYTATTVFTSLIPLTGSVSATPSVSCFGASTGTGNVTNLAGGSGQQYFSWFNGTSTYTTAFTNSLSAGIWSVNVIDAVTSCSIAQSFYITQPAAMNLQVSASSQTTCAGTTVTLTAQNSGGTPGLITPYSYQWTAGPASFTRSVSQPAAGLSVYTISSQDSLGCNTSATVSVDYIVNPVLTVSSTSICPLATGTLTVSGASTYTWQTGATGSQLTASPVSASTYSVIGSALGCTSSATGSIGIYPLPVPFITNNSPVCNGQNASFYAGGGNSYLWSGPGSFSSNQYTAIIINASVASSGSYTVKVTSATGCTATAAINLTVHPTPTISAAGSTVCSNGLLTLQANSFPGSAYQWNGPSGFISSQQFAQISQPAVNATGVYTVKATSAQGCTVQTVAQASVTAVPQPTALSNGPMCSGGTINFAVGGGASYSWSGPNGFFSNLQMPSISSASASASGNYSVTVILGPCVVTATNSVTVWSLPSVNASVTPIVCETKTLGLTALTATNITQYLWQGPNNYSSLNALAIRSNASQQYAGNYTLTVTDVNGCMNSTTVGVNVYPNPVLVAKGATVCLNQPAVISASGAASYYWTGPSVFSSSLQQPTLTAVSKLYAGTYTVMGTSVNSCTSVTTVSVNTRELPVPFLSVIPSTLVCPGTPVIMEARGASTYKWKGPNNIYLEGQQVTYTPVHNGQAGTFTLFAYDALGCFNYTYTEVKLHNLPQGYVSAEAESGCVPFCTKFTMQGVSAKDLLFSWNVGGQNFTENFDYCFDKPGVYSLTGTILDRHTGCTAEGRNTIEVYPQPVADFKFEPEFPDVTSQVEFISTSNGYELNNFQWYFNNNKSNVYQGFAAQQLFEQPGEYAVALVVTDGHTCVDTIVKKVTVTEDFTAFIPNAFTPNGDKLNDVFTPVLASVKKYEIHVFDRWGVMVYSGTQTQAGWDGNYKNEPCEQGVYSWTMQVSTLDGKQRLLKGHVTLMR